MAVVVVANPTSGRGKGAKLIPQAEAMLRSLGVDYRMEVSKSPADPERLAREAARGGATVVAALGGDGHVGNVANGLVDSGTTTALAVIPAGTGNDYAAYLGLNAKQPMEAVRLFASPSPVTKMLDVVRVTTPEGQRYFVNVGGTGFDSEANEHANQVKLLKGTPKYIYSTFVTLVRFKPARFTIAVDGVEEEFPGMMVAVGNAVSYGGGMKVTPGAKADDGELELCVLGAVPKRTFIATFPKVFKGNHVTHPSVRMLHGKEIRIAADRVFQVYGDGERLGPLPATFTVVPGVLPVVVPPGSN